MNSKSHGGGYQTQNSPLSILTGIVHQRSGYSFSLVCGKYGGFWIRFRRNPLLGAKVHICLGWVSFGLWNRDLEVDLLKPLIETVLNCVKNSDERYKNPDER